MSSLFNPVKLPLGGVRPLIGDREFRRRGLAWARAWRARMKPHFDALYGAEG